MPDDKPAYVEHMPPVGVGTAVDSSTGIRDADSARRWDCWWGREIRQKNRIWVKTCGMCVCEGETAPRRGYTSRRVCASSGKSKGTSLLSP